MDAKIIGLAARGCLRLGTRIRRPAQGGANLFAISPWRLGEQVVSSEAQNRPGEIAVEVIPRTAGVACCSSAWARWRWRRRSSGCSKRGARSLKSTLPALLHDAFEFHTSSFLTPCRRTPPARRFRNKQSKTGKKSKKGAADAAPAPTSASTNGVPSESAPVKVGEHLKESAGAAASEGGDGGKVPNGHSSAMPAEEVVRGKPAEEEARTLPPAQKPAADVDVPVIVAKKTQAGVPTREAANADVRAVSPVPPAAPVAPAAVAPTPEHPEEHTPSTTNGVGAAAISKFLRERDERMRVVLSAALELEHAVASASLGAGGGRDADARADALLRTSHDLVQRLEASNVQPALRGAEGCFPAVEQALVLLRAAAAQREKANVPGAGRAPQASFATAPRYCSS